MSALPPTGAAALKARRWCNPCQTKTPHRPAGAVQVAPSVYRQTYRCETCGTVA